MNTMHFEYRAGPSYGSTRSATAPANNRTIGGFNPAHLSESRGFDGKRVRKAIQRRTIDYNSTIIRYLTTKYAITPRDYHAIQPEASFIVNYLPSFCYTSNPISCVTTKFIHQSTNKVRCPVNAVRWTPEGRRLVTGSSSGEFTFLAHDAAIRTMRWSHNDTWMISGDDTGVIKYWQSNMNNLKAFQAHPQDQVVRDLCFSPTDAKFASCSDDGTIKIWSFADAIEEQRLTGHGWDVKCVAWHPYKGILASGSKDNLAKIWDPKTGKSLATLHGHKNTIMQIEWNKNGNWLLTACRDHLVRVYDIRTMKELKTFKGHQKEVQSIAWHPIHENLFVSGGWEGSIHFWLTDESDPVASMEAAHESSVFALDWHPLGHILCSGSNDHSSKFWTRNRPGEALNDRYNMSKADADALGLRAETQVDEEEQFDTNFVPGLGQGRATNLGDLKLGSGYKKPQRGDRPDDRGNRKPQNQRNDGSRDRNTRDNYNRDQRGRDSQQRNQRGGNGGGYQQRGQDKQRSGYRNY